LLKGNAKEIRERVLKYLRMRRTPKEIENYFGDDLKRNGINFPIVEELRPFFMSSMGKRIEFLTIPLSLLRKNSNMPAIRLSCTIKGNISQREKYHR